MKWKIIHLDETDSTNRWLRENSDGSDMVVVADYQTAGRGCDSHTWESERGKNLLLSVALHPHQVKANEQFLVSMAVANALVSTTRHYLIWPQITVKWPNDIYANHRKLCGVLIENRLKGDIICESIVGIGLNVNQTDWPENLPNPTSMCQQEGIRAFDIGMVFNTLLNEIGQRFDNWNPELVRSEYNKALYRAEGFHSYRDAEGGFEAELAGVEDDGHLQLIDRQGRKRRYAFKEVEFVIAPVLYASI